MRAQNNRKLAISGSDFGEDYMRSLRHVADVGRLEKIDHLRKAIADRTYHLDAADVAFKIMEHMQEP